MYRLLIASENELLVKDLREYLNDHYHIEACGNGKWTLELFSSFLPDVIVVDDKLVDMDAFTLIRAIRSTGERIGVILLSTLLDALVESQCIKLGVNGVYLKPYKTNVIASQIQVLSTWVRDPQNEYWNIEDDLNVLLSDLGFRFGPDRYRTIRRAIIAKYSCPSNMMKSIYLDVARLNRGNAEQVEKAVRDAIKVAWRDGNPQLWDAYFKPKWNRERRCPTNEEFIAKIANCLKRGERQKLPIKKKIV